MDMLYSNPPKSRCGVFWALRRAMGLRWVCGDGNKIASRCIAVRCGAVHGPSRVYHSEEDVGSVSRALSCPSPSDAWVECCHVAAPTRPSPRWHQCSTSIVLSPLLKRYAYMGAFSLRRDVTCGNCSEEPSVYEEKKPEVRIADACLVDEEDA
jgi:hypothetical protein